MTARVHARRPGTSPPGRIFLTVVGAVGLLTCWAISAPAGYFLLILAAALAWSALGTIWGVWLLVAVLQRAGREGLRRRWRRWLSVPAITLLVFANVALDAPLRMRLALSEPALRAAAVALASGESMRARVVRPVRADDDGAVPRRREVSGPQHRLPRRRRIRLQPGRSAAGARLGPL
jgi:hypothetical protein